MRGALGALALALLALPARAIKVEHLAAGPRGHARDVVAERVVVRFSSGTTSSQKAAALALVNGRVLRELPEIGWTVVQLSSGAEVLTAMNAIKVSPVVAAAVPDSIVRPNVVPDDPGVPGQYSLTNTDAFAGWDITAGQQTADGKPVTIAFIDTGMDGTNQPDIDPKLVDVITGGAVKSQFFDPDAGGAQSNDSPPTPACDHGTQTSSVAAAVTDNGVGIAGVSWGAQLISLRVFNAADCTSDCENSGGPNFCSASDSAMAAALDYAASTLQGETGVGHLVINISLGDMDNTCSAYPLTQAALAIATGTANIPITISAGNDSGAVEPPADCAGTGGPAAGIIPVGSTNSGNGISYYSSNGPELAAHGVVAPGEMVTVDTLNGQTATNSGTSFSAPFTAGLAALMLAEKPTLTPAQIETNLRGGAVNIGQSANAQGAGQVDVFRTLHLAQTGTLSDFVGDQKAIAFPNPFRVSQNGEVTITVPVSLQSSNASTKIYTPTGVLVRTLSGLTWDGRNDAGQLVASGTYVFEVKTDAGHTTGRLAVIR